MHRLFLLKTMKHTLTLLIALLLSPLSVLMAQEALSTMHFKPRDHALGDVHPFFHEGECFLYYLKPGKYESALARSRDWLTWTETPITHEVVKPDDWMSPYFVLGVFHDPAGKVFRSFYGHAQGRMASSVSDDLLRWSCAPKEFHVPAASYYERRRDPFVFWIPEMKQYGCVMTTQIKGRSKNKAGAISLATSPDLKQWQDHGPILDPGNIGEPECPQMFRMGQRWYLLASIYDRAVGPPVYWVSDQPLGPWGKEPAGRLDGKDLCAAQIAFDGDTPVLFGWIPLTPAKPGQQPWGGHLALPREMHSLADGTLGTRLPGKLIKAFEPLLWRAVPDFTITAEPHTIEGQWQHLAAEITLLMPIGVNEVRVRFAPLGEIILHRTRLRVLDGRGECWSELPAQLPADQPITVRLFIEDNIVELFVHDRYSLAARLPASAGPMRLSLKTDAGKAQASLARASEWHLSR